MSTDNNGHHPDEMKRLTAETETERARLAGNRNTGSVADTTITADEDYQLVRLTKALVNELDELRSNVFHTGGRSTLAGSGRGRPLPPPREAIIRAALAVAMDYKAAFAAHLMIHTADHRDD